MITALISSLLGIAGGIIPDIVGEVKNANAHKRELELLKVQTELQLKLVEAKGDARFEETQLSIITQESQAFRDHLAEIVKAQFAPTGVIWVDVLNSVIRPATALLVMVLFFCVASVFAAGVIETYLKGSIDAMTMAQVLWGSMIGEATQAVLGFLFGYRVLATKIGQLKSSGK